MSSYNFPEYRDNPLLERIVKLEKEVRQLRSHNPLNSATQNDEDGVPRIVFGRSGMDGDQYGVSLMSEDGTRRIAVVGTFPVNGKSGSRDETGIGIWNEDNQRVFLATDESGLILPAQQMVWLGVGKTARPNPTSSTSATWETLWESRVWELAANAVETLVHFEASVDTTCEFRLRMMSGGQLEYFTPALSLTDETGWFRSLWQPNQNLMARSVLVQVQVRRISGLGFAWVYTPFGWIRDAYHHGATASGHLIPVVR